MKIADRSGNGKVDLEELIPAVALWHNNSLHTEDDKNGGKFVTFSKQLKRLENMLEVDDDLMSKRKDCSLFIKILFFSSAVLSNQLLKLLILLLFYNIKRRSHLIMNYIYYLFTATSYYRSSSSTSSTYIV